MTKMKRLSVSLPDEIVEAMEKLKTREEFRRCSDAEIIRRLLERGLAAKEGRRCQK